jgi:HTH-type transcriptional regulator/antitoxin HipB
MRARNSEHFAIQRRMRDIRIICSNRGYARFMKHRVRWAYDPKDLGEAIRRARRQRGLTQAELGDRLGVGRMTVSRLEKGESVSVETALRALSECGYAVAIAPKFTQLRIDDDPDHRYPQPGDTTEPGRG